MSEAGGLSAVRLKRMSDVLRGYVERGEVAGVVALVSRHDAVHVEAIGVQDLAGGAPMRRDSLFRIASMTKPVAAVAAMMLVEEAKLRLDDPVDRFLPELADRRVLRTLESELDDTLPANRPITLRDLLTFRLGIGAIMAPSGTYPIQKAIAAAGVAPGPSPLPFSQDEFMRRIGELPLLHQPGEQWRYHTGSEILGVLVARAAGVSLGDFLAERIFSPLGMKDTGFSVPEAKLDRFTACYKPDAGRLSAYDQARGGRWSKPPAFESGGGGLVSTADDFLAFGRMMLKFGRHGQERLLARPTVEAMTADHLTPEQKALSFFSPGFWDRNGWGFGVSVTTRRDDGALSPGSYGWDGGFGTTWRADPKENINAILLTQRMMSSPALPDINSDFLTLAYQAIDD